MNAQQSETKSSKDAVENPPGMSRVQKATLLSLVPGGGQIYNERYWKVPVIYVGFGVLTYSFIFYNKAFNEVRLSYIQRLNNEPVSNLEYQNVPTEMLYSLRESYRKSRDLSAIGLVGWYAFNLIDAAVDAHLKEFDVSDKLTLKVKPQYGIGYAGTYTGLNLQFRLK
ncbi:MAG: DUF5683 domain-containing protein [bacterium]|nr:DUF5683 domain-containing protein [bacterium]